MYGADPVPERYDSKAENISGARNLGC